MRSLTEAAETMSSITGDDEEDALAVLHGVMALSDPWSVREVGEPFPSLEKPTPPVSVHVPNRVQNEDDGMYPWVPIKVALQMMAVAFALVSMAVVAAILCMEAAGLERYTQGWFSSINTNSNNMQVGAQGFISSTPAPTYPLFVS
jgi:hypothetical protein